jgi:hypothetical protein
MRPQTVSRSATASQELGTDMMRTIIASTCLLSSIFFQESDDKKPSSSSFEYDVARGYEIKPHRRTIPLRGVRPGFNQLRLTLIVSPAGDVVSADASGDGKILKFWPQLKGEVSEWKFTPFQKDGMAVIAEVEEYIDLGPPERLPKHHVAAPVLRPKSKVLITLDRTGCYGTCPSYTVRVSTDGITFNGRGFVVASSATRSGTPATKRRCFRS